MLTIQPKILNNYQPAFKSNENTYDDEVIDLSTMSEDSYESMKSELQAQRAEFEELSEDSEFKLPKPVNKLVKGGAVITTGLLGGMATGWGTKKSLGGLSKLAKTKAVRGIKNGINSFMTSMKKAGKVTKKTIITSDSYKNTIKAIKNTYAKFGETTFGKPVTKFLNSIGSGIKSGYKAVAKGLKNTWKSIKGVKKETWEKATVNTVGVSGGIASGVTALKEKGGKEDNE